MSQAQTALFALITSGQPFVVPNMGQANNTSSLVIGYTINGAPTTLTLNVEGLSNSIGGELAVLDSYSGNTNTTRTIALNTTFDNFRITGIWSGGLNVTVSVSFSTTGAGAAFSAVGGGIANIHTQ